jgi:hypothetical protein
MHFLPAFPEPLRLTALFFRRFVPWYFFVQPVAIVRTYIAYAAAFLEVFSFIFLLKTLVSPWKGIADTYPPNMLQLGRVAQVFTLNCTARVVGAVVRLITIVIGLVLQCALFLIFTTALLLWITFPVLVIAAIHVLRMAMLSL